MSSQEVIENHHIECESDEDDNNDDWDEMETEEEPTQCLFCNEISKSIEGAIVHLKTQHHIDLSVLKGKFHMDQYSYIKMINYVRTSKITPEQLLSATDSIWSDDAYLKPVVVDAWLMFDFEDLEESGEQTSSSESQKYQELENQLKDKDAAIEQLLFQISKMQTSFRDWVDRTGTENSDGTTEDDPNERTTVAKTPIRDDESYFLTYAHFNIHHEMLSDSIRTSSYRDAILLNKNLFDGKTVLDLGCGTSILSMFSSKAGAKKVIAIDQSDIIIHAIDIARRNKLDNIEFVKGRLENISLPLDEDEKIDIIISEWMGYFLLFEGMLDSVIYARDKYLKAGGSILPNRCTISLVGFGDEQRHGEYVSFWNNVYGFDMSIMQAEVLKEAIIDVCDNDYVLSEPVVIADLNITTVDYNYSNFVYDFEFKIVKDGKFTAFVGYFDTFFDLENAIEFTTGPHSEPTHWKQVLFYIKDPVPVTAGDIVKGQFQCRRGKNDARALRVKINAFNQEFYYSLN